MGKYTFSVFCFLLAFVVLPAQTSTPLPYFNGFEDEEENSKWIRNHGINGSKLTNRWKVSSAESFTGDSCLMISNNDGVSASYSHVQNTAVAYREFLLPPDTYDMSLVWKCMGQDAKDGLYICLTTTGITSSTTGKHPLVDVLPPSKGKMLSGSADWVTFETQLIVPGIPGSAPQAYRLYLVWDNDASDGMSPSVCVDNLQIASASACPKPEDVGLDISGAVPVLSWKGSASQYQVMYRRYGESEFDTLPLTSSVSVQLPDVVEGVYDFWVRSVCGGDSSNWTLKPNVLVYWRGSCIDFLNIKAAECTTGTYDEPTKTQGHVDKGYADWYNSRHTVHYIPGETDPFTNDELLTVPPGEVASVRLGSATAEHDDAGATDGAESITYTYRIGSEDNIIMVVKYAVVYEAPDHPLKEQPQFLMEILDENGNLIGDDMKHCSEARFSPPAEGESIADLDSTWHVYHPEGNLDSVLWKNWTTVGMNLSKFKGQTIKVRFTVKDCALGAHYTHAFFTVSCAEAALSGYTCGVGELSVTAPEGFDYYWYNPKNPQDTLSTEPSFGVDRPLADTLMCRVLFKGDMTCYFELPAYFMPRNPIAEFEPVLLPSDTCANVVKFDNTGGVELNGKLTNEPCEYVEWTWWSRKEGKEYQLTDSVSPLVWFSDEGDTIDIRLVVGISNNDCMDTADYKGFVIPAIGPDSLIVRDTVTPQQLPYLFDGGKTFDRDTVYRVDTVGYAGCDSTVVLYLTVVDKVDTTAFADSVCYGGTYHIGDYPYPNRYKPLDTIQRTFKNVFEHDSVVIVYLHVIPEVKVEFDPLPELCADAQSFALPYRLLQGDVAGYSLRFDTAARSAGGFVDAGPMPLLPDTISVPLQGKRWPGRYSVEVVFHTEDCGDFIYAVPFTMLYPTSIMQQKWNDVIALLNADNNYGAFEYSYQQWYKNGVPISGANASYIYIGDKEQFAQGDEYRVELERKGENVRLMSCPLYPKPRQDTGYITLVGGRSVVGQRVEVNTGNGSSCIARWYSVDGRYVGEDRVDSFTSYTTAPAVPGIYVLQLLFDGETVNYKVVVSN